MTDALDVESGTSRPGEAREDFSDVTVVLVAAGDRLRSRATTLLTDVFGRDDVTSVGHLDDVPAETPASCLVVADDAVDDLAGVVAGYPEAAVIVLATAPSDRTTGAALDAGAADVVPVDESNRFGRLGERVAAVVAWGEFRPEATARITEELKEQAMDEAPVGITIADFSLPDRPLVYVNRAFCRTTGYSPAEALGRNCRYLQGPDTDPESVAKLRRAVDAGEPTSVELLNYRRDGSEFWNRVDIAPIENSDGEVTHYVGFQTDITARVRAEEAAERYAAAANRERERLQGLLEHIEGLLEDVTGVLVRAESRTELERGVCEQVADAPSYAYAWVGDCDLAPDTVVPKVWTEDADEMTSGDAVEDLVIDRDDTSEPVGRAVSTRTPRAGLVEGTVHAAAGVPFEGVVAVPLLHRETLYGVLVVYTHTTEVEEHELVVLGTVGRAVGAAIDAFESRRTLLTESVVELQVVVDDPTDPLVALATEAGCSLASEGFVVRDDGTILVFVSVTPPETELDAVSVPDIEEVRRIGEATETGLFEVVLPAKSNLSLVAETGGRLTDLGVDPQDGSLTLTVTVADRSTGRALLDGLREVSSSVRVGRIRERDTPPATRRGFVADVEDALTEKQRTALQLAHVGGFFEWPHGISGDELADAMGVSRSTFHQHLRAAEKKLVSRFHRDDS
ncbi:bacterio-opsin activator [Salinigranum rubrum]|uniref:Bacterio-opsin activator n=1 Tax=Salinigranum rubrum TaxID=755307 RepID=A0A2I8VET2_9EURY|nr:bacterio-opsin activator domain-containing protein [Salinigranum rubrum]AUV80443.1 bacterio-opsin activator [Salinigranum rubrum]